MNAIPLINNIPKANTNAGSIGSPVNAMRQNPYGNETQLRQEINTSLVALKREAGTLEELINEAAQMLVTINNRIATLENDTVKKSDVVDVVQSGNMNPATSNAVSGAISALDVSSVGGSGKYISAISEADGKISATASNLATSVASGSNAPVTSEAVYSALENRAKVRKSSSRSTIDAVLADLGITSSYLKIAFNNLNTNINSYTTGFVQISTGGPEYCFILYKLTNGYYTAEIMSYSPTVGLDIIKFCKDNTYFQGIRYYI